MMRARRGRYAVGLTYHSTFDYERDAKHTMLGLLPGRLRW